MTDRKPTDAPKPDLQVVRDIVEAEGELHVPKARDDAPPPADGDRGDGSAGTPRGPHMLPPDCPVVPLGTNGFMKFYIDANRHYTELLAKDHSKMNVFSLFGERSQMLQAYWPRKSKGDKIIGFKNDDVAQDLIGACSRLGDFDPSDRVRGAGAWEDDDGSLILHCGDGLYKQSVYGAPMWQEPGIIGRYVYSASPAMPRPLDTPELPDCDQPAALELRDLLEHWAWARPEIDAHLLLGWIAAAMLGGALDWRPLVWITGDQGTGKSWIHKILRLLFVNGLVDVSDATAAGVYQRLKHAALPVAIDEIEPEVDSRRAQAVIKLARQAASGGLVLRGDAAHKFVEFKARSCFLFSSVLVPPLMPQDFSRMVILELNELGGRTPPLIEANRLRLTGQAMLRHIADQWRRWGPTLEAYRNALIEITGHVARGADLFGNTLAAADLAIHDSADNLDERAEAWAKRLAAFTLDAWDGEAKNHDQCLQYLLDSQIDPWRSGERRTVAQALLRAIGKDGGGDADARIIENYGMKVVMVAGVRCVAIANRHEGLARIFKDTQWGKIAGTTAPYVQALRRVAGAQPHGAIRFAGQKPRRCTVIPWVNLFDDDGAPEQHHAGV